MINFIKKQAAKTWAHKHVEKSTNFKTHAVEDQEKLLLSLVREAEKTLFGRAHRFEEIQNSKDFQ